MKTCSARGRPLQREPLTKTDAAVFRYVSRYVEENGISPTHQEVCDHFGWSSLASAHEYLNRLVDKGWLTKSHYQGRAYAPVTEAP